MSLDDLGCSIFTLTACIKGRDRNLLFALRLYTTPNEPPSMQFHKFFWRFEGGMRELPRGFCPAVFQAEDTRNGTVAALHVPTFLNTILDTVAIFG